MNNELNTVDALSELGEWTQVKGYPNYRISSNGRIRARSDIQNNKVINLASDYV